MSWNLALLILITDVISKGSEEYVHLRNLARVLLLTNNIKFEVDGDSGPCTNFVFKILDMSAVF